MGFTLEAFEEKVEKENSKDLQKYYSELFREAIENNPSTAYSSQRIITSIFSRTRVPTDTYDSRELSLLDIDKAISLGSASLH